MPYKNPVMRKAYHKKYNREWERRVKRFKRPERIAQRRANYSTVRNVEVLRKHLYGITPEEYAAKKRRQKNRCALCRRRERQVHYHTKKRQTLSVDHNHKTNQVRGLLCSDCNRGLGLFREDPKLLIKAARYLRKYKE